MGSNPTTAKCFIAKALLCTVLLASSWLQAIAEGLLFLKLTLHKMSLEFLPENIIRKFLPNCQVRQVGVMHSDSSGYRQAYYKMVI